MTLTGMITEIGLTNMRTTTGTKAGEDEKSASHGSEKCSVPYRTYESDKDGRLIVYPALYPPKDKGIFNLFKNLVRLILPEKFKKQAKDRGRDRT